LGEDALAVRSDAGDVTAAKSLAKFIADRNIKLDAVFINAASRNSRRSRMWTRR
jgi:hypothetical protein